MIRAAVFALLACATPAATDSEPGHAREYARDYGRPAWRIEADRRSARIRFVGGVIDVVSPDGVTIWYRRRLTGPVVIAYDVMAVSAGGANDAVSDANAFWMARDVGTRAAGTRGAGTRGAGTRGSGLRGLRPRDGAFAGYDDLETYYVGIGGNRNTTTRFRRYVGRVGDRPLRAGDDRRGTADLLQANVWTHVRLIADGSRIAVERDGRPLFALTDPAPYTSGYFGLRTTKSHLRIRNVSIVSLDR